MTYRPVTHAIKHFASITQEVMEEDPINKNNLSKLMLAALRRMPKYATSQIDAATNREESFGSLLDRSIATGQALREFGVKVGDPVCVMGRNHLDVIIPFYASILIGAPILGLDMMLKKAEHRSLLSIARPKIVFCETQNVPTMTELSEELGFTIITFTKLPEADYMSFEEFVAEYAVKENVDDFQAPKFDPAVTTCLICCTSGSTGLPKLADLTHANVAPLMAYLWTSEGPAVNLRDQGPVSTNFGPVYWFTTKLAHILAALYGVAKVQTSTTLTPKVMFDIINKYRPVITAMTPGMAYILLKNAESIDWTCIKTFLLAGSACPPELMDAINKLTGRASALNAYGLTEASGRVFWKNENVVGSLGELIPGMQARVVNLANGEEAAIGQNGELWIKGPNICRGYYNDEETTVASFTADGYFKTGDLVRKDEQNRYFYVDRLKSMLNTVADNVQYHISPVEIENEVKRIQGVSDAVVTGVKVGDLDMPIAVVVRQNGSAISEKQIVEYIKKNMSKSKHLTGGVMFVEQLPLLAAGKIDRLKLRDMANNYYHSRS